jgi:hypothetical protein
MSWRPARSIQVLQAQLNAAYPGRSRSADGTIGDTRHQQGKSEHNPDDDVDGDGRGEGSRVDDIVRGVDVTNDPAHGCDTWRIAQALAASRDPRILYVISNRRICSSVVSPWRWRDYSGSDPHTGHLHMSLVHDIRADDTRPWAIGAPAPAEGEIDMAALDDIKRRLNDIAAATGVPGMGGVRCYESGVLVDNMVPVREGVQQLLERPVAAVTLDAAQLADLKQHLADALGTRLDAIAADVDRLQAAQVAAGQAAAG